MYNESPFVRRNILMEESDVFLILCKKALSSPPILTELLINGPLWRRPIARSNPQKRDKAFRR